MGAALLAVKSIGGADGIIAKLEEDLAATRKGFTNTRPLADRPVGCRAAITRREKKLTEHEEAIGETTKLRNETSADLIAHREQLKELEKEAAGVQTTEMEFEEAEAAATSPATLQQLEELRAQLPVVQNERGSLFQRVQPAQAEASGAIEIVQQVQAEPTRAPQAVAAAQSVAMSQATAVQSELVQLRTAHNQLQAERDLLRQQDALPEMGVPSLEQEVSKKETELAAARGSGDNEAYDRIAHETSRLPKAMLRAEDLRRR